MFSLEFDIEMIGNTIDEINKFIRLTAKWVQESEKRRLNDAINRIQKNSYFIDHCWIKRGEEIVGVVKIKENTFYGLGLSPKLSEDEIIQILETIIDDVALWRPKQINASVNEKYYKYLKAMGFVKEFSREQMETKIRDVVGKRKIEDYELIDLDWRYKKKFVEMFLDAYKGSIDEKIEMFTSSNANYIMRVIKSGEFGKVIEHLSPFVVHKNNFIGGAICTYFEESLFVAIIGVRRDFQGMGIGRGLLTEITDRAIDYKEFEKISLWVTTENTMARKLYVSMGFKPRVKVISMKKEIFMS